MLDPNGVRPFLASVVCPPDVASQHVLGPLQPLKANDGCRSSLRFIRFNAAPRKSVDLLPGHGRLLGFRSALACNAVPWVGDFAIELLRVEPVNDLPGSAAEGHDLLSLPQPFPIRPPDDQIVEFVCC